MTIALVGATGVLGRALMPLLREAGQPVRLLVRSPEKARQLYGSQVEVEAYDLLAEDQVDRLPELLAGCEVVAHLATAVPDDPSKPGAWDLNNRLRTEGAPRLVAGALAAGAAYYLQQSIVMTYPDCGDDWITEAVPLDPARTPVIVMEAAVRAIPPGKMNWCILRGGAFLGPGTYQDGEIARLKQGQQIVPCDGRPYLSAVHVADMARAIATALVQRPENCTLNIVAEPLRLGDYFDQLAAAVGAPRPPRSPEVPCPPSQRCSHQAATETLGWEPIYSIIPES